MKMESRDVDREGGDSLSLGKILKLVAKIVCSWSIL